MLLIRKLLADLSLATFVRLTCIFMAISGLSSYGDNAVAGLSAALSRKATAGEFKLLRWSENAGEFTDSELEKIFNFTTLLRQNFGSVLSGPAALQIFKKGFAKRDKDGEFFVVLDGDKVVATAGIEISPRTKNSGRSGELQKLYIGQEVRGQGIGSTLLAATEEFARSSGVDRIRLETYSNMAGSHALYETEGYLIQGYFAETILPASTTTVSEVVASSLVRSRTKLSADQASAAKALFLKALALDSSPPPNVDMLYVYEKPLTPTGRRELLGEHFVKDLLADQTFGGEQFHSLAKTEETDPEIFDLLQRVGFKFKNRRVTYVPDQLEIIKKYEIISRGSAATPSDPLDSMVPVIVQKSGSTFNSLHGSEFSAGPRFRIPRVYRRSRS